MCGFELMSRFEGISNDLVRVCFSFSDFFSVWFSCSVWFFVGFILFIKKAEKKTKIGADWRMACVPLQLLYSSIEASSFEHKLTCSCIKAIIDLCVNLLLFFAQKETTTWRVNGIESKKRTPTHLKWDMLPWEREMLINVGQIKKVARIRHMFEHHFWNSTIFNLQAFI